MRKRVISIIGLLLILITLFSCNWHPYKTEVAWEGALGGKILFEYYPIDDFSIFYLLNGEKYYLAGVGGTESSEILTVMEVSPDEKHLVILKENSTWHQLPHGTRLWVFNLSVLPDGDEFEPLLDVIDPEVLDATINNEKVDYQTPPDVWLEYIF